jgi:hypothetical protein
MRYSGHIGSLTFGRSICDCHCVPLPKRGRRLNRGLTIIAVVSLVAAFGATLKPAGVAASASSQLRSGSTRLDGRWQTGRITLETFVVSARRVGATRAQATDFFHHLGTGTKRYARITLLFRNGDFSEYQAGDGGRAVIGNEEPYKVRNGVLRLLGSGAEAGCVASFRYVIWERHLRLSFISVRGTTCPPASAGPHWGVALYTAAPFSKH